MGKIGYGSGTYVVKRRLWQRRNRNKKFIVIAGALVVVVCALFAVTRALHREPVITLLGEDEQTLEVYAAYTDPGAQAQLGKDDISNQISVEGEVNTQIPGDYEISYVVAYHDKMYSTSRTVHVQDSEAPVLELADADVEINASSMELYEDPGFTAHDNFDGNLTSQVDVILTPKDDTSFTVTYNVWDQAGNKTSLERTVVLKDTTPPEITPSGETEIFINVGETYDEPGATAVDDLDGDISGSVTIDGYVDVYRTGSYTITYTVTDAAGNEGTATRKVTVAEDAEQARKEASAVYLTFDDGPSTKVTEKILDVLKENDVKATFFIIGYDDSSIPLLKRMVEEGHTIGIHALDHDYQKAYETDEAYLDGVLKMKKKIKEDLGYDVYCIRFPGGSSNSISKRYNEGVMTRICPQVQALGFQYYDWNVDSTDAEGDNRPVETLVHNVTSELQKGRANVVLCHDTNAKETTAEALQQIIDYGKENGYKFRGIEKDTTPVHHSINN